MAKTTKKPRQGAPVPEVPDYLCEYVLHRAFQRARICEWADDLRDAARSVHTLAEELEYSAAMVGRANNAKAGDLLAAPRIRAVGFRLRELCGDRETHEARLLACGPLARPTYVAISASGFDVGALDLRSLEALGGFLRRTAARMRGWNMRFTGGLSAASRTGRTGRLPDVAAVRLVGACRSKGVSLREAARAAISLGIEQPRGGDGADPVALLADRWRQAARRK